MHGKKKMLVSILNMAFSDAYNVWEMNNEQTNNLVKDNHR